MWIGITWGLFSKALVWAQKVTGSHLPSHPYELLHKRDNCDLIVDTVQESGVMWQTSYLTKPWQWHGVLRICFRCHWSSVSIECTSEPAT